MDYRLTDAIADPSPEADSFATERLVRFAPTAWTYQPPEESPESVAAAGERRASITFGCFNYLGKITDSMLVLWGRLLGSTPDSRLMLKGSGFGDPAIRERYLGRLRRLAIDTSRVTLIERTASIREHLALYGSIDIALDTFPYHGTTTTCEALWMGVPVVSMVGDRHVSRVGASLLTAAGHPEWIASSGDEYIRIASCLASNASLLAAAKRNLRKDILQGPLMDHAGQGRRFGDALRACWLDYCSGSARKSAKVDIFALVS
jgi:predicted O-linked N-acetylglucosamine transferase (SPINDLY family)